MTPIELNEFREQTSSLHRVYTGVFQTIDVLLKHPDPLSQDQVLNDINSQMEDVRRIEANIAPMRDALASKHESMPDDLSRTFASIAKIIEELLPRINQLENQARESKARLAPGISEAARMSHMKQAYAQNAGSTM